MPIDFDAIAAQFKETVALEARRTTLAQQAIAGPLGRRLTAATQVHTATRGFPIIRFYNGAPVMRITASQLGTLAVSRPPPSVGQGLVNGAFGFLGGIAQIWAPLKKNSQETALGRFTASLDEALKAAEASVKRFEHPTPEMFDPDRSKGSDIVGLAALAFRALDEASSWGGQIEELTSQVARAMAIDRMGPPLTGNEETQPSVEPGPARSLRENFDVLAFAFLGGIVVLASLPHLVDTLLRGVVIRARVWLLDELTKIERSVLDFRADMLRQTFQGVVDSANDAINLLGGVHEVVGTNILFLLKFWRTCGTQFATGVRDFADKLVRYFQDWVKLLQALPGLLSAINAFDLTLLLRNALGGIVDYVPSLRLDELLDSSGEKINLSKYHEWMNLMDVADLALDALAASARAAGGLIGYLLVRRKIAYGRRQVNRVRNLMNALFPGASWNPYSLGPVRTIPQAQFLEEASPLDFRSDFPNLDETLMGSGRAAKLLAIIDSLKLAADSGLKDALTKGYDGLMVLANESERAAARAANFRDEDRLRRAAEKARLIGDRVLGPEALRERAAIASRTPDPLAVAFGGWLAGAGFKLLGEVIPVYVRELSAYWQRQVEEGEELTAPVTPTSPHILRQRAVLGKVAVPRITLRTGPRRALDEPLLELLRDAFRTAVERSYRDGQRRLSDMAAAGAGTT